MVESAVEKVLGCAIRSPTLASRASSEGSLTALPSFVPRGRPVRTTEKSPSPTSFCGCYERRARGGGGARSPPTPGRPTAPGRPTTPNRPTTPCWPPTPCCDQPIHAPGPDGPRRQQPGPHQPRHLGCEDAPPAVSLHPSPPPTPTASWREGAGEHRLQKLEAQQAQQLGYTVILEAALNHPDAGRQTTVRNGALAWQQGALGGGRIDVLSIGPNPGDPVSPPPPTSISRRQWRNWLTRRKQTSSPQ